MILLYLIKKKHSTYLLQMYSVNWRRNGYAEYNRGQTVYDIRINVEVKTRTKSETKDERNTIENEWK